MTSPRRLPRSGFWPTPRQILLLRAALLPAEEATQAWRELDGPGALRDLDPGSARLLPLVYASLLARRGAVDASSRSAHLPLLKGLVRRTWYANQTLLARVAPLLQHLEEAGIPTLVLKGAALASLHYRDVGMRPMDDVDVLVPMERAADAIRVLNRIGLLPVVSAPDSLVTVRHSHELRVPDGVRLDLHWHVFWDSYRPEDDAELWRRAVPLSLMDVSTRSLCPAHLLAHVLAHGAMWSEVPPVRWAADAMTILSASGADLDWEEVVDVAARHRLALPLSETLTWLRDELCAAIPSEALRRISALPVSRVERLEYRVRAWPHGVATSSLALWMSYRKASGSGAVGAGFLEFLRRSWDLPSRSRVPAVAFARLRRRLLRSVVRAVDRAAPTEVPR